jgi:DnaJ-class molecular chaperone
MNLYEACINLDLWHVAKARAEVWAISKSGGSDASLDSLKLIAKDKFRELALIHHPDKGGTNSDYIEIQESYDMVKKASTKDFIRALEVEIESSIVQYKPGSPECRECSRWSSIFQACITSTCTGFRKHAIPSKSKRWTRESLQGSGFFSRRSRDLGQATG